MLIDIASISFVIACYALMLSIWLALSKGKHISKLDASLKRTELKIKDELGSIRSYVESRFLEHEMFHKPITYVLTEEVEEVKCSLIESGDKVRGSNKGKNKAGRPRKRG